VLLQEPVQLPGDFLQVVWMAAVQEPELDGQKLQALTLCVLCCASLRHARRFFSCFFVCCKEERCFGSLKTFILFSPEAN
jgi:hypothetical protein